MLYNIIIVEYWDILVPSINSSSFSIWDKAVHTDLGSLLLIAVAFLCLPQKIQGYSKKKIEHFASNRSMASKHFSWTLLCGELAAVYCANAEPMFIPTIDYNLSNYNLRNSARNLVIEMELTSICICICIWWFSSFVVIASGWAEIEGRRRQTMWMICCLCADRGRKSSHNL